MDDLFAKKMKVKIPERVSIAGRLHENYSKHILSAACVSEFEIVEFSSARIKGFRAKTPNGFTFAIVDKKTTSTLECAGVLLVPDAGSPDAIERGLADGSGKWIHPLPQKPLQSTLPQTSLIQTAIRTSWKGKFHLRAEEFDGETLVQSGLRPPQVGAIHAVKAHWSVSSAPATLVMPTGTGKTETMLSLMVSERIQRLLVIVPTDQLRTQIAGKFIGLGVLKACGCLEEEAQHPIVTTLKHAPKTIAQLDDIFLFSQVVVSTMQVLTGLASDLKGRIAEHVSHLFVDEAHHIGANTWRDFKAHFSKKHVLQFTATPFRNDGRRVDGKFIYVYPLRKAQEDGLFRPIQYLPVHGLDDDNTDDLVIGKVGEQIEADRQAGFNHLVMARTSSVDRAVVLHQKYLARLPQHAPQLIHSKMSASSKLAALTALREHKSRIIVCVDMLGEGFDLPDLKIAALHDKHRSEAVTLQFIGRFTRARSDLGDATVIANVTIDDVNERLKALYAEDADWNRLLSVIGHSRIERERKREDLFSGFPDQPEQFPLETFEPRMNTIAYKTTCTAWKPDSVIEAMSSGSTIVEGPFINPDGRLVVFVTRDEERLRWTRIKQPQNVEYNMFMAHWDDETNLLYINSSRLGDLHTELAKKLAGDDVDRISGEPVFRVLHGFRRLVLMNLGLSETQRKPVRYSQFMGSDIADQLDTLPGNRSRTKTNLFGQGFIDVEDSDEEGRIISTYAAKETIGCSTKGKIWSYQTTNSFAEWIDWCHGLGRKLMNDSITNDTILRNVIRPKRQEIRPDNKVPIAIAWPERFLHDIEDKIEIEIAGVRLPFFDCEIEISEFTDTGPIHFKVGSEGDAASFEMLVSKSGALYTQAAGPDVIVHKGRKSTRLVDIFKEDPPHVYFSDGDMLVDCDLFVLPREEALPPFDLAKIEVVQWKGVNIRKESQGIQKHADSIQRFVIERLLAATEAYDIIFDDDGSGEVADVVAIRRSGRTLKVDLFHCKYSSEEKAGARAIDLYEVCGQAQKSVRWAERHDEFLKHLMRREGGRQKKGEASRYEKGNSHDLHGLINQWRELRPEFSITIVQPGYSMAQADKAHLELLAATESFLMETWRIPLRVMMSA